MKIDSNQKEGFILSNWFRQQFIENIRIVSKLYMCTSIQQIPISIQIAQHRYCILRPNSSQVEPLFDEQDVPFVSAFSRIFR